MSKQHPPRTATQIRPLTTDDLDAVVELSLLAWEPAFVSFENILGTSIFNHMYQPDWRTAQTKAVRSTCLDETAEALVATTTDGVVTGFVVLKEDHEESLGVIEMIAVHPLHQRQGFARLLLEFAIERLTKQGLRMINVGTGGDPGHAPARALYEAVGFTQLPLASYFLVVNNQP